MFDRFVAVYTSGYHFHSMPCTCCFSCDSRGRFLNCMLSVCSFSHLMPKPHIWHNLPSAGRNISRRSVGSGCVKRGRGVNLGSSYRMDSGGWGMAVLFGFRLALLAMTLRAPARARANSICSGTHVARVFSLFRGCWAGSASKRPYSTQLQRMCLGSLIGCSHSYQDQASR